MLKAPLFIFAACFVAAVLAVAAYAYTSSNSGYEAALSAVQAAANISGNFDEKQKAFNTQLDARGDRQDAELSALDARLDALESPPPPPPAQLTVTVTAPAAGDVSGVIVPTATVSDPAQVSGVTFYACGGQDLGQDLTAPYAAPAGWDTSACQWADTFVSATAWKNGGGFVESAPVAVHIVSAPPPPPGPSLPPQLQGQGYSLNFNDEFDGTSYDSAVWTPKEFWESEPRPGAIVVSNGTVKISNAKPYIDDQSLSTGPYWGPGTVKKKWTFGYFEARMKWSAGKGSWPAFWLLAVRNAEWFNYPNCSGKLPGQELDVVEWLGVTPARYYGSTHRNPNEACGVANTNEGVVTEPLGASANLASAFHTYGMRWDANGTEWYVDNVSQGTNPPMPENNQEMFISLTMQACGWDSTNSCTTSTPDPLTTEVDWVRVWQK